MPKKATPPGDAAQVAQYLETLQLPQKAVLEAVRAVVLAAGDQLSERIKWNAPSYYYIDDIVTFGPLRTGKVFLVFHHPLVVQLKSPLLEGDYKDRRLMHFADIADVQSKEKELTRIVRELVKMIGRKADRI